MMNTKKKLPILLAIVALFAFGKPVLAKDNTQSVAVGGYDIVSYFTDGKPVKGVSNFAYYLNDTTYLFANKEHKDLFIANPEKYLPQYGGYCAFGMTQGKKFPIDPEAWKIVDGKIYFNLNQAVQKRWVEDIPGNIKSADENWVKVKDVAPDKL